MSIDYIHQSITQITAILFMIRRKNKSPHDSHSPSQNCQSQQSANKCACRAAESLSPCKHARPARRYSYNLAPDPDLPSPYEYRASSIMTKHISKQATNAAKSLGKGKEESGKMVGRLRKGHLYNEQTSLRHSHRSLSRSRDTLQLDTFNNSGNQTHLLEQLNASVIHAPDTVISRECVLKRAHHYDVENIADRKINLEPYITFKQPQRVSPVKQRQQTDPELEDKYQELWNQNQKTKSREINLSMIPSSCVDDSLRDITNDMIINVQTPAIKHQPGRFANRASRRDLIELSNSKPTYRGPHRYTQPLISKEQVFHQTLPYLPPPQLPPQPILSTELSHSVSHQMRQEQAALEAQQAQQRFFDEIDNKLRCIDDFNQRVSTRISEVTTFMHTVTVCK